MRGGQVQQRPAQFVQQVSDPVELLLAVQARIHQHLVVTRARGVNVLAGLARVLGQVILHARMYVLVSLGDGEAALLRQAQDLAQVRVQRPAFLLTQNANLLEHRGMGQRAPDIVAHQAVVQQTVLRRLKTFHLLMEPVAFLPEFSHLCVPRYRFVFGR
jgi:hypothetical protein